MENENLDLDVKPAGNKDLWLFLIIVDIVLLCVFGFFIYKYVSADLFRLPSSVTAEQTTTTTQDLPEPEVEEVSTLGPEEQPIVVTATPTEETLVSDVLAASETPTAQTAEPVQEVVIEQPQPETKTSVLVEVNPKSNKYRKVTFRWFGEGESVAVVSGFTNRKPQALTKVGDHWETTLSIAPGTYKFLYVIDGKNTLDPYSKEQDGRSVVEVK